MIIRNKIAMDIIRKRATAIELQEPVRRIRRKTTKKLKLKLSTIAVYVSVFALIVVIVFTSYQSPKDSSSVANVATVSASSVDNIIATSVAANVAIAANLPIANNVTNLAVSARLKNEIIQMNSSSKAPAVGISVGGRSVISYTVKDGDTIDSISTQFGISKDTIKWANNLYNDNINVGKILQILPINGVIYEVQSGDTIESIANIYSADANRVILYNDLDVSGLIPKTKIILPDAVLPLDKRPGYVSYYSSGTSTNMNEWGYCTWYAFERRVQLNLPVQSPWGNARDWAYSASRSGYLVDYQPSFGAILVSEYGYYGHVAIVEKVEANGDILISEMNYVGYNVISSRKITAGQASLYKYIH